MKFPVRFEVWVFVAAFFVSTPFVTVDAKKRIEIMNQKLWSSPI